MVEQVLTILDQLAVLGAVVMGHLVDKEQQVQPIQVAEAADVVLLVPRASM